MFRASPSRGPAVAGGRRRRGSRMVSVCIFTSGGPEAPALGRDLAAAGLDVTGAFALDGMVQGVIRSAPDVVVCYEKHPGDALFAVTAALADTAPRPTVLFTADPDAEKIERAAGAGVHAYVVNGYAPHRLRSVIHVAQARFRRDRALREELSEVRDRFAERKLVDRAKGILMRVRDVPEEEAFRALRSTAMQQKQRIGQVAQSIIDATRYADAVNRAGQLRMLSQRIVKLCALAVAGIAPDRTAALHAESVAQAERNLSVLGRTLSRATFGDLLDGVLGPWSALKAASTFPLPSGRPGAARLAEIDRTAERLLLQAEALTRNLETAGVHGGTARHQRLGTPAHAVPAAGQARRAGGGPRPGGHRARGRDGAGSGRNSSRDCPSSSPFRSARGRSRPCFPPRGAAGGRSTGRSTGAGRGSTRWRS